MSTTTPGPGLISRLLAFIERAGNALPHPATLFAGMAMLVVLVSAIAARLNLSVVHPGTGEIIAPVSLLSISGLHRMLTSMVSNFTGFAPLGTVLVAMLGIAVAEGSGLIGAALRLVVLSAPRRLLTFAIVFAGVMSNTGGEEGYVLLVPLAASIFLAVGRHPIGGLAAAFAGVSGGYSANLLLGTLDPLLAGLSEEAARIVDPAYTVNPSANYYFMAASSFVIAATGTLVTELVVMPRLGEYRASRVETLEPLGAGEKRGLLCALLAAAVFTALLLWGTVPATGFLRDPATGDLLRASGLGTIPLIVAFVLISAVINLFMGSASAKWAIMAPVFVPMFMLLGYAPEFTQAAYRVGDSVTNIISPMMSYFALIVAFMQRYDERAGIGTIVATMLPYSVAFFIVWTVMLIAWVLADLPLGPGARMFLDVAR